jgi:hypothetical protein
MLVLHHPGCEFLRAVADNSAVVTIEFRHCNVDERSTELAGTDLESEQEHERGSTVIE